MATPFFGFPNMTLEGDFLTLRDLPLYIVCDTKFCWGQVLMVSSPGHAIS